MLLILFYENYRFMLNNWQFFSNVQSDKLSNRSATNLTLQPANAYRIKY